MEAMTGPALFVCCGNEITQESTSTGIYYGLLAQEVQAAAGAKAAEKEEEFSPLICRPQLHRLGQSGSQ